MLSKPVMEFTRVEDFISLKENNALHLCIHCKDSTEIALINTRGRYHEHEVTEVIE